MKSMILACAAALVAALSVTPASAQVTFSSTASATTPATNVTFDFDDSLPVFTGGGQVVSGSAYNHAQPMGSTGNYFALGPNNGGTTASLFFGTDYAVSAISWIWGSLDAYNSIQFFGDDGVLIGDVITGSMITAPSTANGSQVWAGTNRMVTFNFTGDAQNVRGVNLVSTVDALEMDDISIAAAVPEPGTWAMLVLGFGVVAATVRRRQRVHSVA